MGHKRTPSLLNAATYVITWILNYSKRDWDWTKTLMFSTFFAIAFFVLVHYLSPVIK